MMNSYSVNFTIEKGYAKAVTFGKIDNIENLLKYTDELVVFCNQNSLKVCFLDQTFLSFDIGENELYDYISSLLADQPKSLDVHFVAMQSRDGGKDQRFFQDLSEKVGFKFEIFESQSQAESRATSLADR